MSSSTSNGEFEEGELVSENHKVIFDRILDGMLRYQEKSCQKIHREDVIPLAQMLTDRGCRIHSALWIAIKFAGIHTTTPDVELMALGAKVSTKDLVLHEAEDLQRIDWNLAPLARECGLMA